MLAVKHDFAKPPLPTPPGVGGKACEVFEVDLRDTLQHTTVRELTLEEFRQAVEDLTRRKAA